jgi:CRISPR/Cas system-associated exonuclease Cas4 (RecB family)
VNSSALTLPGLTPASEIRQGDPLEYLSASRLKCFQTCRLQFYFRYVERIPVVTSPALYVGKLVHTVLQEWNLRRWRGESPDAKSLWPFFADHWTQDQSADLRWYDSEEKQRDQAWSILEHYLQVTPIPLEEKPEAVEVVVERDLLAHGLPPLKGVIDLVRGGGRIVDFKTAARTPDEAQAAHQHEVQLGCYALLYREATGNPETGFELHHLIKTKEPKLVVTPLDPMGPGQIQRLLRVMESYVAGVMAEDFVPSPGQHCSWCDYFAECRAWKGGSQW